MKFDEGVFDDIRANLVRLGVEGCTVCGTKDLKILNAPATVTIDGGRQTLYAIVVECPMCGQMSFFNVERYYNGDVPVLKN